MNNEPITMCHVSASGGSASGEMNIDKALGYVEELDGTDTVRSIAIDALRVLEAISPTLVIELLDMQTDGHWQLMP